MQFFNMFFTQFMRALTTRRLVYNAKRLNAAKAKQQAAGGKNEGGASTSAAKQTSGERPSRPPKPENKKASATGGGGGVVLGGRSARTTPPGRASSSTSSASSYRRIRSRSWSAKPPRPTVTTPRSLSSRKRGRAVQGLPSITSATCCRTSTCASFLARRKRWPLGSGQAWAFQPVTVCASCACGRPWNAQRTSARDLPHICHSACPTFTIRFGQLSTYAFAFAICKYLKDQLNQWVKLCI